MANVATQGICWLLFRLLLPLVLLAATVVRYNGISLIYGLLALGAPLLPAPTTHTVRHGSTGRYLIASTVICSLCLLGQVIFQIILLVQTQDGGTYGAMLPNCSAKEKILRQVGFQRLEPGDATNIVRIILPDIGSMLVTVLVLIGCWKLLAPSPEPAAGEETAATQQVTSTHSPVLKRVKQHTPVIRDNFGYFMVALFLALSGIAHPSLLSVVYFLAFLIIATWWACGQTLGAKFAVVRVFLMVYSGGHLIVIYLYQFQFFQESVAFTSLAARLAGLTAIVRTDCHKPWLFHFHDNVPWPWFVSPAVILALYYTLAYEITRWSEREHASRLAAEESSSTSGMFPYEGANGERQHLVSASPSRKNYQSMDPVDTDTTDVPPEDASAAVQAMGSETAGEDTATMAAQGQPAERRSTLMSIMMFLLRQSYVLTLIAMMAWSITFHSWLTFVLLIAACVIWMIPGSQRLCLRCSPVIVFYAEGLLLLGYAFSFNLKTELPTRTPGGYRYREIGMQQYQYPCLQLAAKIGYTFFFWLTMYQFVKWRHLLDSEDSSQVVQLSPLRRDDKTRASRGPLIREDALTEGMPADGEAADSDSVIAIEKTGTPAGEWIRHQLSKYWILVCAAMFLLMALQEAVIYRIIYMVFFLLFVLTFQMCYRFWRVTLTMFWCLTIFYSMLVLILIYTYQFSDFPGYWKNGTGISDQALRDIGLRQYDTGTLFVQLLTPTSFLIVIILQLHYFQKRFLAMSDINRYRYEQLKSDETEADKTGEDEPDGQATGQGQSETAESGEETEEKKPRSLREDVKHYAGVCCTFCSKWFDVVSVLIWRLLEIHIFKLVAFTVFITCCIEVKAVNVVFVLLLVIGVPIPQLQSCISHVGQIWAALVILAKMIFQLSLVNVSMWYSNCTSTGNSSLPAPFNETIDNAQYVGLEKASSIGYYLRNYIAIVLMLGFQGVIQVHQQQFFNKPGNERPPRGVLFADIKRAQADVDLLSCIKFFANYTFYKFGLEICFVMSVVTVCVRLDGFAVLYCLALGVMLLLRRKGCFVAWPGYIIFLAILLVIQYLSCLGAPLGLCWAYPWDSVKELTPNLKVWLFLPSYTNPPDSFKLLLDFFQLLFVSLQWCVFYIEHSKHQMEAYGGGDNADISEQIVNDADNPLEDFTSVKDSYLDYIKTGVFQYLLWVTLFVIFITGLNRISLFNMGYLIGCFVLLWMGQEMILKPFRSLMRMWYGFLAYNFIVILVKCCLQVVGCVYLKQLADNSCWVVQLFGIACMRANQYVPLKVDCTVPEDEAGLAWDVVCFTFLLIQLRVFRTHYFRHVVLDHEVQNMLASRGAELINRRLIQRVDEQKEKEDEVLQNIKDKMDRIRQRQAKVVPKAIVESDDHFVVVRSGDYYMFEDQDEEEKLDTLDIRTEGELQRDPEKTSTLELVHTTITEGTAGAAKKFEDREAAAETTDSPVKKTDEQPAAKEPEEEEKVSACQKIKNVLVVIWAFIASILDYFIITLNNISKDFRDVHKLLEEEKREEKARRKAARDTPAIEDGTAGDREPATDVIVEVEPTEDTEIKRDEAASAVVPSQTDQTQSDADKKEEQFKKSTPRIFQVLIALYDAIIARSEVLCYFAMILNVLVSASLLVLPYPFSIFLWAMLCVPRPTKNYWITAITYTEAIVVVKYLFQFGFFPWNSQQNLPGKDNPFWPPRIIGVEKKHFFAVFDLILLFTLFIHRSVLKKYGLWRDAIDAEADLAEAEMKESTSRPNSPPQSPSHETAEGARAIEGPSEESDGSTEKKPGKLAGICSFLCGPVTQFYKQMTNPKYNAVTDVYALLFLCDFINFVIIVFGYQAFGPRLTVEGGDVSKVLSENRVPVPFLVMLLAQFVLIIIDRGLFLRKSIFGKFLFQIILVIVVHIWLFFILPEITGRKFTDNVPAQLWYFIKCVYFGLSAYQIRSGYPTRILGNFLTKNYNYTNLFLYKGFLAVPFLLELRALMDWMWTDTTLGIGAWLQVEDIYSNIFVLKCWRTAEKKYPTPRGQQKKKVIKYGVGGLLLFLLIFIIWFPLVLFSFANAVFEANRPYDCSVQIRLGGYQPIFQASAQQQFLLNLTDTQYHELGTNFGTSGAGFLQNYQKEDIVRANLTGKSRAVWGISPPSEDALIQDLNSSNYIQLYFSVSFTRVARPSVVTETVTNQFSRPLNPGSKEREQLTRIIQGDGEWVLIEDLFPRFLRVPGSGVPSPVSSFRVGKKISKVWMSLKKSNSTREQWWELREEVEGEIFNPSSGVPHNSSFLTIIGFNDRVAPASLSILSGYGIIGLYVSFVIVIGRLLRVFATNKIPSIWYTELPYVDRVLILLLDIYLVREAHEFRLEEELFAKLIFLYRSPETLIKVARPPKVKLD